MKTESQDLAEKLARNEKRWRRGDGWYSANRERHLKKLERRFAQAETYEPEFIRHHSRGVSHEERTKYDRPGHVVLWERMKPGAWYGRRDLLALMPEFESKTAAGWMVVLVKKGMVEKRETPCDDPELCAAGKTSRLLYRRIEDKA